MFHASRYGCTEQRRRNKEIAWREMKARGKDALRYLTANSGRENIWYWLYARRMTEELQPGDAAEVLLEFAHHESAEVRKMAVFLLGFCGTPQHAPLIRPLLADADARGAAARTLGKWKDRASVTGIVECLHDAQDRRRAQAATALGDIGDPSAVPALIEALGDPVGVVREAARRALTHLPADAAGPTLKTRLPFASGVCAREIIRCLGLLRFRPAFKELGRIALNSEDPWLRGEAVRALKRTDAARAEGVLKSLRKTETHPFVRSCLDPSPDAMR
jgi:HEAT repeat protein